MNISTKLDYKNFEDFNFASHALQYITHVQYKKIAHVAAGRMTSFSYPSMVREFYVYRKLQMAKFCCSESEVLRI